MSDNIENNQPKPIENNSNEKNDNSTIKIMRNSLKEKDEKILALEKENLSHIYGVENVDKATRLSKAGFDEQEIKKMLEINNEPNKVSKLSFEENKDKEIVNEPINEKSKQEIEDLQNEEREQAYLKSLEKHTEK